MRYLAAMLLAVGIVFAMLWIGSWIATTVSPPHWKHNDFTVGQRIDLCGYKVDLRHVGGGYDLGRWKGARCESLSELDVCILECLSVAGTIEIGAACFSDCIGE
jgi:hypothetical protein